MDRPLANSSLRNRLTIGVLVLSAIGFVGAGVGSQALLQNYLINQVDEQLLSVVAGTADRLDQAGIARDDDDDSPQTARAATPLNRVPTSISVTVLDPFGNLVGGIGGDLNSDKVTEYVRGCCQDRLLPLDLSLLQLKHRVQIFVSQQLFCHLHLVR